MSIVTQLEQSNPKFCEHIRRCVSPLGEEARAQYKRTAIEFLQESDNGQVGLKPLSGRVTAMHRAVENEVRDLRVVNPVTGKTGSPECTCRICALSKVEASIIHDGFEREGTKAVRECIQTYGENEKGDSDIAIGMENATRQICEELKKLPDFSKLFKEKLFSEYQRSWREDPKQARSDLKGTLDISAQFGLLTKEEAKCWAQEILKNRNFTTGSAIHFREDLRTKAPSLHKYLVDGLVSDSEWYEEIRFRIADDVASGKASLKSKERMALALQEAVRDEYAVTHDDVTKEIGKSHSRSLIRTFSHIEALLLQERLKLKTPNEVLDRIEGYFPKDPIAVGMEETISQICKETRALPNFLTDFKTKLKKEFETNFQQNPSTAQKTLIETLTRGVHLGLLERSEAEGWYKEIFALDGNKITRFYGDLLSAYPSASSVCTVLESAQHTHYFPEFVTFKSKGPKPLTALETMQNYAAGYGLCKKPQVEDDYEMKLKPFKERMRALGKAIKREQELQEKIDAIQCQWRDDLCDLFLRIDQKMGTTSFQALREKVSIAHDEELTDLISKIYGWADKNFHEGYSWVPTELKRLQEKAENARKKEPVFDTATVADLMKFEQAILEDEALAIINGEMRLEDFFTHLNLYNAVAGDNGITYDGFLAICNKIKHNINLESIKERLKIEYQFGEGRKPSDFDDSLRDSLNLLVIFDLLTDSAAETWRKEIVGSFFENTGELAKPQLVELQKKGFLRKIGCVVEQRSPEQNGFFGIGSNATRKSSKKQLTFSILDRTRIKILREVIEKESDEKKIKLFVWGLKLEKLLEKIDNQKGSPDHALIRENLTGAIIELKRNTTICPNKLYYKILHIHSIINEISNNSEYKWVCKELDEIKEEYKKEIQSEKPTVTVEDLLKLEFNIYWDVNKIIEMERISSDYSIRYQNTVKEKLKGLYIWDRTEERWSDASAKVLESVTVNRTFDERILNSNPSDYVRYQQPRYGSNIHDILAKKVKPHGVAGGNHSLSSRRLVVAAQ